MEAAPTSQPVRLARAYALPALAAIAPLCAAFFGAVATGTGTTAVADSVLGVSGGVSQTLGDLSGLLPFGFSFGAGVVATVNPCGFAMLPAYLALYVGLNSDDAPREGPVRRLGRALLVGAIVTLGFVVLFAASGIVLSVGGQRFTGAIQWAGLVIGVLLTIAGAWFIGGGKFYSSFAQRAATKFGDPSRVSVRGYFLFGLSYGVASLSCALGPFLAVFGIGIASNTLTDSVVSFLLFALGMGTVIIALTVAMALFKGSLVGALRRILPYTQPVSAVLMIVAGSYIVFYWLTEGGLLDQIL